MSDTEKFVLDVNVALGFLQDAVDEKGYDFQDPNAKEMGIGCFNVVKVYRDEDGEVFEEGKLCPSCIAGHVFAYAGVPLEFLYLHNGTVNSTAKSINEDLSDEFEVTKDAAAVLRTAQRAQDDGKQWGYAFDAAKDIAAVLRGEEY